MPEIKSTQSERTNLNTLCDSCQPLSFVCFGTFRKITIKRKIWSNCFNIHNYELGKILTSRMRNLFIRKQPERYDMYLYNRYNLEYRIWTLWSNMFFLCRVNVIVWPCDLISINKSILGTDPLSIAFINMLWPPTSLPRAPLPHKYWPEIGYFAYKLVTLLSTTCLNSIQYERTF